MEHNTRIRFREGAGDARAIVDLANDGLGSRSAQLLDARRRAHQAGYAESARNEPAHEVCADKSTGAGDQNGLLSREGHMPGHLNLGRFRMNPGTLLPILAKAIHLPNVCKRTDAKGCHAHSPPSNQSVLVTGDVIEPSMVCI